MKQVEEEFLNTFLIEQKYKSPSKGAALILPCTKQSFCFTKKEEKRQNRTLKHERINLDKIKIGKRGKMHIYCHPSSILSFMIPSLDPGLISCECTAQERNWEIPVMVWQWGVPNRESGSPSARQHLLMDPVL